MGPLLSLIPATTSSTFPTTSTTTSITKESYKGRHEIANRLSTSASVLGCSLS